MRFNSINGSLPLPILHSDDSASDYQDGFLDFDIDINELSSPHEIKVKCIISQPSIKKLIDKGDATISLAVDSRATYFYDVIDLSNKETQVINLDERKISGNVSFTLIVKARQRIEKFLPTGLKASFQGMDFNVRKGDILAISNEEQFRYALPPLRVGESIFQLEYVPELERKQFSVDLDDQKIKISVGSDINQKIQYNMETAAGRMMNISAVYFPALVEVLYRVKNQESFAGRAWYEAINSAMQTHGLDITSESIDPLDVAQILLNYPYMQLFSIGNDS